MIFPNGFKVSGFRFQCSAQPTAQKTAGQIENETSWEPDKFDEIFLRDGWAGSQCSSKIFP